MTNPATSGPEDPAPGPRPSTSVDDQPVADLSRAPLPTRQTLRRRQNLAYQATRFAAFNARIMRMVVSGHRHSH